MRGGEARVPAGRALRLGWIKSPGGLSQLTVAGDSLLELFLHLDGCRGP